MAPNRREEAHAVSRLCCDRAGRRLDVPLLGVLCARFRDGFLLAAVIAVSICYLGDAYGHLHQAAIHDNHAPDNTGLTLWADFIAPLVAIALYALWRRAVPSGTAKASPA